MNPLVIRAALGVALAATALWTLWQQRKPIEAKPIEAPKVVEPPKADEPLSAEEREKLAAKS